MSDEEIIKMLTEHCGKLDRQEGRIKILEKQNNALQKLTTSVAVLAEQMKNMSNAVISLAADVQDIKDEPGKKYKSVAEKIILTIVSAVIGYFISKIR